MEVNIFDFDGVLVDSFPAHMQALSDVIGVAVDVIGARFRKAIQSHREDFWGMVGFPREMAKVFHSEDFLNYDCPIIEGIPQVLEELKSAGKVLCLATHNNKRNLHHFGKDILSYFDLVLTRDDFGRKRESLEFIAREYSGKSRGMMGDTHWDYEDSVVTKTRFLGVGYSAGWEQFRKGENVFDVAESVGELRDYLLKEKI